MADEISPVTITFSEEEGRCLAAITVAVLPFLHPEQQDIVQGIAEKFARSSERSIAELVEKHGYDKAEAIAVRILARHPHAEDKPNFQKTR